MIVAAPFRSEINPTAAKRTRAKASAKAGSKRERNVFMGQ